jgi:hypothetical protein
VVTAYNPKALQNGNAKKDPTHWMGGGVVPPWDWRSDPKLKSIVDNNSDDSTNRTLILPDRPNKTFTLKEVYELTNSNNSNRSTLDRFVECAELLDFAYAALPEGKCFTFTAEDHDRKTADEDTEPDTDWRPFRSPYYWAGFIAVGDGGRVEGRPASPPPQPSAMGETVPAAAEEEAMQAAQSLD